MRFSSAFAIVFVLLFTSATGAAPSPDFDNDGEVGFSDFLIFASKFGAEAGQEKYDAACDLNEDGSINFPDFLLFARQFGEKIETTYTVHDGLTVTADMLEFRSGILVSRASSGRCIRLRNTSLNGVVYTIHSIVYQRKTGDTWTDVAESKKDGLCQYTPTRAGEYRVILDLEIGGRRDQYVSKNTFVVS